MQEGVDTKFRLRSFPLSWHTCPVTDATRQIHSGETGVTMSKKTCVKVRSRSPAPSAAHISGRGRETSSLAAASSPLVGY